MPSATKPVEKKSHTVWIQELSWVRFQGQCTCGWRGRRRWMLGGILTVLDVQLHAADTGCVVDPELTRPQRIPHRDRSRL